MLEALKLEETKKEQEIKDEEATIQKLRKEEKKKEKIKRDYEEIDIKKATLKVKKKSLVSLKLKIQMETKRVENEKSKSSIEENVKNMKIDEKTTPNLTSESVKRKSRFQKERENIKKLKMNLKDGNESKEKLDKKVTKLERQLKEMKIENKYLLSIIKSIPGKENFKVEDDKIVEFYKIERKKNNTDRRLNLGGTSSDDE